MNSPTKPRAGTSRSPVSGKNDPLFAVVEPWPDSVAPSQLLDEIAHRIRRHVICSAEAPFVIALWVLMTYLVPIFDVLAILLITAPEMRCGKSELKRLIGKLVHRPLEADNLTTAVLFRVLEMFRPTLLIDEYDTFIRNDEQMRGVINAGHQRGGCVMRCEGDDHVPTRFDVFSAKVLSGIGTVQETIRDRSIPVVLRRKLQTETIERQRDVPATYFADLRSQLARVAIDYEREIATAHPTMPDVLSDRAQDNWEPLFQIANVAGGEWPQRAWNAAVKLSDKESDAKTVGVQLLSDIHDIFSATKCDRISTAELIPALCEDDERPWATYNRGFQISPMQVSKRLREFGICSNTIRINGTTAKGYHLHQFSDAFARYVLTGDQDVTPSPAKEDKTVSVPFSQPVPALNETGNTPVTGGSRSDMAGDGVTGDDEGITASPRIWNQEIAYREFRTLLVRERINSLLDEQGNWLEVPDSWPDGLPLQYVAERIQNRLSVRSDQERAATARRVLRQLVERAELLDDQGTLLFP